MMMIKRQADAGCDLTGVARCNNSGRKDTFGSARSALWCDGSNKYQLQRTLLTLLVVATISNLNGAPSCLCFSDIDSNNNFGLVGFNDPQTNQFTTANNNNAPTLNHNNHRRPPSSFWSQSTRSLSMQPSNFNGNPSNGMPDSFTAQDQPIVDPQANQAHSWTSILTNPFNFRPVQPPQPPQNNNNDQDTLDAHVRKILVPRVSGTPGNVQVREYIVNSLRQNDYHIELDEFSSSTPVGSVKFANIIASSNPSACRQLVLACHYDSKMMDNFLGATDSAVPCAMLLKMSETFAKSFRSTAGGGQSNDDDEEKQQLGLKFVFFDGEEAFVQWSSTDSLYGSRHLAAKWAKQEAPKQCQTGTGKRNELKQIELFVLLDLIGTSDTTFALYNTRLRHHYDALQKYEKTHLTKLGYSQTQARRESAFKTRVVPFDFVEDDHVPFKQRGVPILLLLAHPFPRVWHTTSDNYDAIDYPKTRRILHALEQFVANYSSAPLVD